MEQGPPPPSAAQIVPPHWLGRGSGRDASQFTAQGEPSGLKKHSGDFQAGTGAGSPD